MSEAKPSGSSPSPIAEDAARPAGPTSDGGGVPAAQGGLVRSSSAWMGINWPLQNWPNARRGHSDGHVVPRDAATSVSCENVVAAGRPAVIKRKRIIDVGQKTVKQMNELTRYLNVRGPCAICKLPGAVVTLTQIKKRRRGTQATRCTPEVWSPEASAPTLLAPAPKATKSVSWSEQSEPDLGRAMLSNETGAFLLLVSVVAFIVGILVIIKATENNVKEYLGLVTPTTSLSSALQVGSEELAAETALSASAEDGVGVPVAGPSSSLFAQDRSSGHTQRWYRSGPTSSSHTGPETDGPRRKRLDRWAQTLRSFFSRKRLSHLRAGIQKRWGKKRTEDLAPLQANEAPPAAVSARSAHCSQDLAAQAAAASSTSAGTAPEPTRSHRSVAGVGQEGAGPQCSSARLLHRSRSLQ